MATTKNRPPPSGPFNARPTVMSATAHTKIRIRLFPRLFAMFLDLTMIRPTIASHLFCPASKFKCRAPSRMCALDEIATSNTFRRRALRDRHKFHYSLCVGVLFCIIYYFLFIIRRVLLNCPASTHTSFSFCGYQPTSSETQTHSHGATPSTRCQNRPQAHYIPSFFKIHKTRLASRHQGAVSQRAALGG